MALDDPWVPRNSRDKTRDLSWRNERDVEFIRQRLEEVEAMNALGGELVDQFKSMAVRRSQHLPSLFIPNFVDNFANSLSLCY